MLPLVKFYPDHSQNPLQTFWSTEMVRRFGLVNPGNPSKVPPTCLVFGDNHKYFISSAKNDLPPFLWGMLQGGVLCDIPIGNLWVCYIGNLKKCKQTLNMCQILLIIDNFDNCNHLSPVSPVLGHFETPKEYGRHFHIYVGKVILGHMDHKKVPKRQLLFRGS